MSTELAKAYVQIVPTMQGVKGSLENMLGGEADVAGTKAGRGFASKFGSALGTLGKLVGSGLAAAATGAAALGKQAVENYADYEQLKGGIETLFGAGGQGLSQYAAAAGKTAAEVEDEYASLMAAQNSMLKNASKAYATAGMSANEYMETAIQSGAAMIASLNGDTEKAAALMDLSITDMADNVNKMGTSMEAVQNAYRGFSRGNFTMLDNLALGFAGTKEGMQELLKKAQELSGVKYDINSYADIVQAIHVVQDEMGITGTTAEEAAGTISGSLASMKAAWQNLLTGIASGENIGGLVDQMVSSVQTVAGNLIPVASRALRGMSRVVKELAPVLAKELPGLVQSILPDLLGAATSLIDALGTALPGLITSLAPSLVAAAVAIAVSLGTALAENAPEIVISLVQAITANAPALISGGVQLVISLVTGLVQALPQLLLESGKLILTVLGAVLDGVPQLLQAGAELVRGLWAGISGAAGWLWEKITGWLSSIWDGIKEFFGVASPSKEMAWMGEMLSEGLASGITASADEAVSAATALSADVLGAMQGGDYSLNATGAAERTIVVSGTVRVEGVNSEGELVAISEQIYDGLVARLRQEARYA